jgi:diguanylate cyclase (GGDEF)-like protein
VAAKTTLPVAAPVAVVWRSKADAPSTANAWKLRQGGQARILISPSVMRIASPQRAFPVRAPESGIRELGIPRINDDDITEITNTTELLQRSGSRPRLTIMTGVREGEVIDIDPNEDMVIGRSSKADLVIEDHGVSRRHCRLRQQGLALVLEDLGSRNGTLVNGKRVQTVKLRRGDRIQIGTGVVFQLAIFDEVEETLARRLYDASVRDSLTLLYNRRHFFARLNEEIAHSRRQQTAVCVMLLDLDHFKGVNDSLGHAAGDQLLRAVARALNAAIRTEDMLARYGGEEFAIMTRTSSLAEAAACAERLRASVEAVRADYCGAPLRATISIGVAEISECGVDATVEMLLARADERLYRAKAAGRNCVCTHH